MRVILWGTTAHLQRERLRANVTTPWEIVSVPDVSTDAACEELRRADAFIGLGFDRSLSMWARNLKLLLGLGAGVDLFDFDALPPGSVLCNVYEHETPIAEYVLGAILHSTLRLDEVDREFRDGNWSRSGRMDGEPHGEIAGKTIGLVGYGHIGQAVAKRAKAFDMRVLAVRGSAKVRSTDDPYAEWVGGAGDLDALIEASDFLVVCCPLTEHTRGMIDAGRIARMPKHAFLINVARAEIIEEEALFRALQSRRIAGAALDVWYHYPSPGESRGRIGSFPWMTLDNVVVTPHFSGWTHKLIERRWRRIAENLDRFSRGEPLLNVVFVASA